MSGTAVSIITHLFCSLEQEQMMGCEIADDRWKFTFAVKEAAKTEAEEATTFGVDVELHEVEEN